MTTFNYVCWFVVNMFYCGKKKLLDLNTLIFEVRRSASRAQRPLTVRWHSPSLRGTMWQWGLHAKQFSLRAPYSYFKCGILTCTRWNWKGRVKIVSKTDLLGPLSKCTRAWENSARIPRPIDLWIWLPVRTRPRALCVVCQHVIISHRILWRVIIYPWFLPLVPQSPHKNKELTDYQMKALRPLQSSLCTNRTHHLRITSIMCWILIDLGFYYFITHINMKHRYNI